MIAGFGMNGFEQLYNKTASGLPYVGAYHSHIAWLLGLVVLVVAVSGIVLAYKKYAKGLKRDEKCENSFIYRLLSNQYYIPQLYEEFISKPYAMISEHMWKDVDMKIVDTTVDGIAKIFFTRVVMVQEKCKQVTFQTI